MPREAFSHLASSGNILQKIYLAISAGMMPAGEVNPVVIQAMKETGIDITEQKSKIITEDMLLNPAILGLRRVNYKCNFSYTCMEYGL